MRSPRHHARGLELGSPGARLLLLGRHVGRVPPAAPFLARRRGLRLVKGNLPLGSLARAPPARRQALPRKGEHRLPARRRAVRVRSAGAEEVFAQGSDAPLEALLGDLLLEHPLHKFPNARVARERRRRRPELERPPVAADPEEGERVEGLADREQPRRHAQSRKGVPDARAQLLGRLDREGHHQHTVWRHAQPHQPHGALDHRVRLARARARADR